ncbi:MAG: phosphotransferase, partial [Candidatus Cloacimonadaceae bacterium]|nr:phosphotransferase [Candidatus Cloacimonadaceae bacterium]
EYASRVDDQTILSSLADALKRFHSIKIAPDYAESIDSKINRVRYNISHHRLRKDIYFKGGPRKGNADLSRILGTIPADEGSVLTHGDFNLSNLLFDETGVCAYLDLAEAGFGDPYQDFSTLWASIEACVGNESIALDLLRLVLVRYGISSIDMDKIRFFRLLNELL